MIPPGVAVLGWIYRPPVLELTVAQLDKWGDRVAGAPEHLVLDGAEARAAIRELAPARPRR